MAATPLCEAPLAALKNALRDELLSEIKSSHLSEALAYSLGFRTHAAMLAAMVGPDQDRPFLLLDSARLVQRLVQFGYEDDPEFDFELTIAGRESSLGVVSTFPNAAYEIEYKTDRQKAWRNLMVCAINAAIEQRLFTLRPGDNRFQNEAGHPAMFDFVLPNGLPARGVLSDAGYDEISVQAAVNPKGDRVLFFNPGFDAGDAFGSTWLERRRGAWMQTSDTEFNCRRNLLAQLAGLEVTPLGYGDRGNVIL